MNSDKTNHGFLLAELIRRDFIKKYKRTTFGILWSALSPLLLLLTMDLVFGTFFGRNMPHYTIYLFCGLLLFNYFSSATRSAMRVLYDNAPIYSKVPVPKYYFLISHSSAQFIDFLVSLLVFSYSSQLTGSASTGDFCICCIPSPACFHQLRYRDVPQHTVYFLQRRKLSLAGHNPCHHVRVGDILRCVHPAGDNAQALKLQSPLYVHRLFPAAYYTFHRSLPFLSSRSCLHGCALYARWRIYLPHMPR